MLSGARSEIVAWRGTARTAMGCGAVGVRALRAWGMGARGGGRWWCSGGCAVMLRQPDASAIGKSTPPGLSIAQAHKESVRVGADAHA